MNRAPKWSGNSTFRELWLAATREVDVVGENERKAIILGQAKKYEERLARKGDHSIGARHENLGIERQGLRSNKRGRGLTLEAAMYAASAYLPWTP